MRRARSDEQQLTRSSAEASDPQPSSAEPRQLEGRATISDSLVSYCAVAALERAPTVVHLAGTLNPADSDYERANVLPTQRVASAVSPVRTRSLVFLSYVGASEQSANRYLATKARAERLLRGNRRAS